MRPLISSRFNLIGHDVSLELVDVDVPEGCDGTEFFVLLFEGPTDAVLWQDTWALATADAEFDIFLVPVGPRPNGRLGYESVVNRMTSADLRRGSTA